MADRYVIKDSVFNANAWDFEKAHDGEWVKYDDYIKESMAHDAVLADVRALIKACDDLIKLNKELKSWNLVCDEEIEFENALNKVGEHFS